MKYEDIGRYFIVPYFLFSEKFKGLSVHAKMLYGLFLNRHSLSQKNSNSWTDEFGNIYFIFTIDEITRWLGCAKNKAIETVEELVTANLVSRRQDKRGVANKYSITESSSFAELDQLITGTQGSSVLEDEVVQNKDSSYLDLSYPERNYLNTDKKLTKKQIEDIEREKRFKQYEEVLNAGL